MHVAHQLQEVGLGIYQKRLVTPLEQVPDTLLPRVDLAGMAEGEVLHRPRQGLLARLYHQVHVVGHQAIAVDPVPEARDALGQQLEKALPIGLGEEDVLAAVAPQHHVIEAAGDVQARFPCHGTRLAGVDQ